MDFRIRCRCGNLQNITTGMAGAAYVCPGCGHAITLPTLSEMRQFAGQDAYATNAADKIEILLRDGFVPPGNQCVVCADVTDGVYQANAVCERVWKHGGPSDTSRVLSVLGMLFIPFFALVMAVKWITRSEADLMEPQERGRDKVVKLPLRVCQRCLQTGELRNTKRLREMLVKIPEYAELFREYPEAEIRGGGESLV